MESRKIGRFIVEVKEWGLAGGRIYFTLLENGRSGRNNAQACWDIQSEQFIKCRNQVDARWEHAIKKAFELE